MPLAPADIAADALPLALRAQDNLQRNAAALGRSFEMPAITFCLARDGSLTGYDGTWLAGCSVPRRAAEVMLRMTAVEGNVACLVLPNHAGQIAACLEKVASNVAIIALLAAEDDLPAILACHDFSTQIASKRLMFAWDELSLRRVFDENPGLPLPQQFIRLATSTSETAEPAMKMAQAAFAPVIQAHGERIKIARAAPPRESAGLCVVGPQRFKLWDEAAAILADVAGGETIDTDIAACSASAYVAERIAASRAVVTANMGRADRPELAEIDRPWICWATTSRIPAYLPKSPRDGLLIADPTLAPFATVAGWPTERVRMARFPTDPLPPAGNMVTIVADLPSLAAPKIVCDFSSWRVAWDTIAAELQADPFKLGSDASAYLDQFLRRHDIAAENLPRELFLNYVIAGAFTLGIAKLLKERGAALAIYGKGWDDHADEFDVRGPIEDRATFGRAIAAAGCIVDCFIGTAAHPLRSIDRPLLRPAGMTLPSFIARLRSIGGTPHATATLSSLSLQSIESLL